MLFGALAAVGKVTFLEVSRGVPCERCCPASVDCFFPSAETLGGSGLIWN